MKSLDRNEIKQKPALNRVALFSKGDCERAAISFSAQVNGIVRREFTDSGNIYWVFWTKH